MTLRAEGPSTLRLRLSGDLDVPAGGIVVQSPFAKPLASVIVNGRPLEGAGPATAVVRQFPADIVLQY